MVNNNNSLPINKNVKDLYKSPEMIFHCITEYFFVLLDVTILVVGLNMSY